MKGRLLHVSLLLFGSGMTALIYQVAWMRELRLVFGISTAASAAVLAIFLGGLGVGGWILGRRADAAARPLEFYGRLELAVAVGGLDAALDLPRAPGLHRGGRDTPSRPGRRDDDERRLVRLEAAGYLDLPRYAAALAELEPKAPWRGSVLERRARAYDATGNPLAARPEAILPSTSRASRRHSSLSDRADLRLRRTGPRLGRMRPPRRSQSARSRMIEANKFCLT